MDNTPVVEPIVIEDELDEALKTKHQKYGNLLDYFRPKVTTNTGVIEYKEPEPIKK